MHELLAPAGSPKALEAAILAGADAVYLGTERHNARLSGANFTDDSLQDAVRYCHIRHKKVYLTLNTLLSDRELLEMPDYAHFLSETGIDGVIVQDIGLAHLLHTAVPALPLHASTQMTIHNAYGIARAKELGFQRVVLSREAFSRTLIQNSPLEIEVFIHGALCVSYSGQCYFSSQIARRSGNRGTCAQPCRHRYQNGYALSLHDLCLAPHIPELLRLPIASLKIEGRLKSPDYVSGVVSIYRRLLDEKRAATGEELSFLADLFSRQGFTDAYFKGTKGKSMFGYRTEADKRATQNLTVPQPIEKKIPLSMRLTVTPEARAKLTLSDGVYSATVYGEIPEPASSRPLSAEDCIQSLTKLGHTPYIGKAEAAVSPGLFLSAAARNAMRRDGIAALEEAAIKSLPFFPDTFSVSSVPAKRITTACIFHSIKQIPENLVVDFIWLPLFSMPQTPAENMGAILPTILFDSEMEPVKEKLVKLKEAGLRHVMCQTIGQHLLCREMGLLPHGGSGMHIYNGRTAALSEMESLLASPELQISQLREMPKPLPLSVTVYGRQTLMTMENCLASVHATCHHGKRFYPLTDEKGNVFPVLCAYPHRNEVLNAHPLYMLDKLDKLENIGISGFLLRFTTESCAEVSEILELYRKRLPAPFPFTRGCFLQGENSEKPGAAKRRKS